MKLNKKELDRIVAFVKAVKELPGNEEFIANLREVLEMNYSVAQMPLKSEKIDAIEKYLGLDYSLDDSITIVDYSFVIDHRVRAQLESDCREMMRYRYGTRGHKIDFMEFCRYVQLQAEMLLNYYYDIRFESQDDLLLHLKGLSNNNIELKTISYASMLYGFKNEHNWKDQMLDLVREVRNSQSHRAINGDSYELILSKCRAFVDKFKANNKIFLSTKGLGWQQLYIEEALASEFNKELGMDKNTFNRQMKNLYFVESTPYNGIIDSLTELALRISNFV